MKNILILLSHLLFIVLFNACSDKEITLDLPQYDSKIVINGELTSDTAIYVEISKSIPILDAIDSTGYLLKDATAKLYENNVFIGNMNYANLLYNYNIKPQAGKKYKIEVSSKGLSTATVEVDIPAQIITKSVYLDSIGTDDFGVKFGQLKVGFSDQASTNNYYRLSVRFYNFNQNTWLPLEIITNDPLFVNINKLDDGSFIFSDATFNGKFKTIDMHIIGSLVSDLPNVDKFEVSVKTFTNDYYRYIEQVKDYSQQGGTFETLPIILESNVKNGLGMVGGIYHAKEIVR